jgi:hypothetical protein
VSLISRLSTLSTVSNGDMATVSAQQQSSLTSSRSSSVVNGNPSHGHNHPNHMNGHHASTQSDAQNSTAAHANGAAASTLKKAGFKAKKATPDPSEVPKLLAAKISQLESDQAGEKEEEAEIGKHTLIGLFEVMDVCCEDLVRPYDALPGHPSP